MHSPCNQHGDLLIEPFVSTESKFRHRHSANYIVRDEAVSRVLYKLDDRVLGTPGLWAPRTNTIPPTPPHHPPHHPHRQVLNMNNRESSIKQALEAIENGTSESKAAKDFNIPRSMLYNRRAGRTDTEHGHTNQQRLSPKQEDELCRWIIEQEARGYAPSHERARETAVLNTTDTLTYTRSIVICPPLCYQPRCLPTYPLQDFMKVPSTAKNFREF